MRYEIADVVIVCRGAETIEDGMVAQVIDRDPIDNSYLLADMRDVGKANCDIPTLLNNPFKLKWVKTEYMKHVDFDKPKFKFFSFDMFVLTSLLGLLGYQLYDLIQRGIL